MPIDYLIGKKATLDDIIRLFDQGLIPDTVAGPIFELRCKVSKGSPMSELTSMATELEEAGYKILDAELKRVDKGTVVCMLVSR